jgi:hypothetical protein
MTDQEKKEALIKALENERDEMVKNHNTSPIEHNATIEYLKTGKTDKHPDDFELLDAAMNDYKTFLSDYGIK